MIAKMPVKVNFDPPKSGETRCADVWNIPAGRILMLLWRPCHLCSDRWWDAAYRVADAIQKHRPTTPEVLAKCFIVAGRSIDFGSYSCVKEFCADAIDYFTGAKGVPYEGVVSGVAIMEPGKDRYL